MLPGFIPKSSQQTAIKRTSSVFEVVGYEGSYRSAGVDGAITGMGGECVVEGTFISTPMGVKKIEELGAGDLVLSYNRTTDKIERTRINKTKCVGIYKDVIWIKTRGGRSVCLTNEHPVCTYNDGYVSAYDLEIDTKILSILLTKKGTSILVTDIIENIEPYKHLGYVYDLEVDQNHNYFANGVLVHNCLIIDDPIKTNAEADSLIMRDHLWNWYKSTFYTRLNSGGGIVIIQTRWHEDDLVGRLLDADRAYDDNKWKILNFPAIAEVDDEYRKAGEALHPERYPLEQLELTKRSSGSRAWASLYQQRPAPEEGHIFHREWFKYWNQQELPKDFTKIISSWDMSFKDTKTSDFVVGQVWGIRGGSFYLLDQIRKRMGFVETCEAFERIVKRWPQTREKLVEDKANGTGVIDFLKRKISGIIPISPTESKVARANMVTVFFEAGNVFFPPKNMYPWVDDLEAELCTFPTGVHDDQVDSLTQALTRLYRHGPLRISNWKGTVSNAPQIGSRSSFNLSYGRVNPRRPFHG
jgi:predicted phage terminase large subunit-like protein